MEGELTDDTSGRRCLTISAFCRAYGVGRTYTYSLINSGALDARKAGKRTLITAESAERWFDGLDRVSGKRE